MKTLLDIIHYEEGEPRIWTFIAFIVSSNRCNSKTEVLFLVQWKAVA